MITSLAEQTIASAPGLRRAGNSSDLWTENAIDANAFSTLRRRAVLEGCKWDPQVGDVDTLSPFPLVMKTSAWKRIALQAEQLAAEALAAEQEIARRPELLGQLGLPSALRQVLADKSPLTPAAGRVMRFDFHPTTRGWQISEVNSDVPGGFSEASYFTALMAQYFPGLRASGNAGKAWSDALAAAAGTSGVIGLLSAPGYMEDHQVIAFLAARLRERGCRAHLAKPEQILWRDGVAHLRSAWYCGPLDVIVKFYQAEWLSRLPAKSCWEYFFRGGSTPVANPTLAVISESKRFPLVWERLSTALPAWRALLPETRDPRDAPWSRDGGWLVKTAMCNTGDTVSVREWMRPVDWLRTRLAVQLSPNNWVAQRRFESVPVPTPVGPRHACVGVYTVNGRAAGSYARLSVKPVVDFAAAMPRYSSKTMTKEEIFSIWAPDDSPWSRWVKPVLFAHLDSALAHMPVREVAVDVSWSPPLDGNVALVLDLPGAEGVWTGVALASRGYRPVPLYNALPLPFGERLFDPLTGRAVAAVDVAPILAALRQGAEKLAQVKLPLDAPPVFLLDASRQGAGVRMQPDEFDNRSISFTTDFPSANFLASRGIQRVRLVQMDRAEPQADLAHSLRRWQDGGLKLERMRLDLPSQSEFFEIARPSWYGAMFQRVLSSIGFRRSSAGGFGAWIADSSAGG
jgi:hypothetical protein